MTLRSNLDKEFYPYATKIAVSGLLDAHTGDRAGDHQLLDLARALEDGVDLGVALSRNRCYLFTIDRRTTEMDRHASIRIVFNSQSTELGCNESPRERETAAAGLWRAVASIDVAVVVTIN